MGEGRVWENEVWPDLRPERRIKLTSQGVGANRWIHDRRNRVARGINNRLVADDSLFWETGLSRSTVAP